MGSTKGDKLKAAHDKIAKLIAENMPDEILDNAIEEVVHKAIELFKVDHWEITNSLSKVVDARAQELLKTKYAKQVDELAERAVSAALRNMGQRP